MNLTLACVLRSRKNWPRVVLWYALFLACAFALPLWAAPFDKQIGFTQPDGTRIQLHGKGDEFSARFETLDGYTAIFDPALRAYCYATVNAEGKLVSTGVQVQEGAPVGMVKGLRMSRAVRHQLVTERVQRWEASMQAQQRWSELKAATRSLSAAAQSGAQYSPPAMPTLGLKVGLTLLVDFSDDPATVPQADIVDLCNGDNYSGYGNNGSVKKYFFDVSNGALTYTNVVTVYLRVPQPKTYYNDITQDSGHEANLLIKDALDVLKALPNYDTEILPAFDALTVDGNNEVIACNVFFAGANSGVWTMGLWPHSWSLVEVGAQELSPGGKKVFRYQITDIGDSLAIGTFCHENGHMLCGFPDLYDYEYDSIGGAGFFSLMAAGNFDKNPVQVDAYLKRAAGWTTVTELDANSSLVAALSAAPGTNFNHIYRFEKPGVPTEYYLVENRQQTGRDALMPGSGLAIWHVDELGDRDNQSLTYNYSHANYELTLVQADNLWDFERNNNMGDPGDLFYAGNGAPGYVNQFSDATAPSARWWDGSASGIYWAGFSVNAPIMTFRVGSVGALKVNSSFISGGNGNGIVDFNECNDLFLAITNASYLSATNIRVSITTTNAGVFLPQPSANYGTITAYSGATNLLPFKLSTAPEFLCGTPIILTVTMKSEVETSVQDIILDSGTNGILRFDNSSPVQIPDAAPDGTMGVTNSSIVVANISSPLQKVTVSLFLKHPYDGSIALELVSPDGTAVALSQYNGGIGADYGLNCAPDVMRTTFDDDALNYIYYGRSPYAGIFKPEQPLAAFIGKSGTNVNGTWHLRVRDALNLNQGILNCWSLFLTTRTCTDGGGQCPGVNLAVGMVDNPDPATIGSNLVYTITVTNSGPGAAKGVVVSHTLPSSVQFISAVPSQGGASFSGGVVTCTLGSLNVGATATVQVTVLPTMAGTIFSSATVASTDPELSPEDNAINISTIVVPPVVDLTVGIADSPDPVIVGGSLTYVINVTNNGPATATGVLLSNSLPPSVLINSIDYSQGTIQVVGNTVLCKVGVLDKRASASLTVRVTPTAYGTIYAAVTASALQTDPILANNSAVAATTVAQAADLAITMGAQPNPAVLSSNVTYSILVTNRGPNTATNVVVSQSVPAGATVLSATSSQGAPPVTSAGSVTANLGTIVPGASATITVAVKSTKIGVLSSTAVVTAAQADPNPADNSVTVAATVSTPFFSVVAAGASLTYESLTPPNGALDVGETNKVRFQLQNIGNIAVSNLVATLLPSGGILPLSGPQTYGKLLPVGAVGGVPVAEEFTFKTLGGGGNTAVATLQIQDGSNTNLAPVTFSFVLPNVLTFANTNRIVIPSVGMATNYPSTITVSGVTGQVSRLTASITGFTHSYPHDVSLLLVGPTGVKTLLMSHALDMAAADNLSLTFDDLAASPLPGLGDAFSGAWQPAAYAPAVAFSNPAPAGPYSVKLADFNGVNANGTWSLYVLDDSAGDAGGIANGWSLALTSATPVNQLADVGLSVTAVPAALQVGADVTYIYTVSNAGPSTANGVTFSNALPVGTSLVLVTNSQGNWVTNGALLTANLASLAPNATATIAVTLRPSAALVPAGAATGSLTNVAVVSADETDLHTGDNRAVIVSTVGVPAADLGLSLSAAPATAFVGSNVLYTLTVTNSGPGAALNVLLADPLPAGLAFVAGSASQGTVATNATGVLASLGDLAPGASATVTVALQVLNTGSIANTATVQTGSADTNAANNIAAVGIVALTPAPGIAAAGAVLLAESFSPANGALNPGETVTVSLLLTNGGAVDTANLTATLLNSGGLASSAPPASYGRLVHGGASVAQAFTFTAGTPTDGRYVATLQLQDGTANLGAVSFTFQAPASGSFASSKAITIPDRGAASPYPASILVSNLSGVISKLSVAVNGLTHSFPNDVNLLLVSPAGRQVLLMSHCGGAYAVTNLNLTFDDAAGLSLPDTAVMTSGSYRPSHFEAPVAFPAPARTTGYEVSLAALNGLDPNGTWSLFVLDDSSGDAGAISAGWSLNLTTVETVNPAADLAVGVTGTPAALYLGSTVTYTVAITNLGPADAPAVSLTNMLPSGFNFVSASSSQGQVASQGGAVVCNLGALSVSNTATVVVTAAPTLPGTFVDAVSLAGVVTDLTPGNNAASVATVVSVAAPARVAGSMVNGRFHLDLSGQSGLTYVIEASTNLTAWVPFSTNTLPTGGRVSVTDTNTPAIKTRFYRAVRLTP